MASLSRIPSQRSPSLSVDLFLKLGIDARIWPEDFLFLDKWVRQRFFGILHGTQSNVLKLWPTHVFVGAGVA
jgi:hypothetical protein